MVKKSASARKSSSSASKNAPAKKIVKSEPGKRRTRHAIPDTRFRNICKAAGHVSVTRAVPGRFRELLREDMRRFISIATQFMADKRHRTYTEQDFKAAHRQITGTSV